MALSRKVRTLIDSINGLLGKFGTMTVRQVYYQLVPLGYNYRQIAYALNTGRELGLVNLDSILDRSRPVYGNDSWDSPEEVLEHLEKNYKLDYWADEPKKVEIWTEKDALSAILYEEADQYRVKVRVTRGYLSTSNKVHWSNDETIILYFGDFDPSGLGIDLDLKSGRFLEYSDFHRIALTMGQIKEADLPSVPVKNDDPRAPEYIKEYGKLGWELDALNPDTLRSLVSESIRPYITFNLEQKRGEEQEQRRLFKYLREG